MILPTYNEATNRVAMEVDTPLDLFISEHEPSGVVQEQQFRRDLQSLLDYVEKTVNEQWQNDFERLAVPRHEPGWNGTDGLGEADGVGNAAWASVFMAILVLIVIGLLSLVC